MAVIAYPKMPTTQEALYYMVKNQITVQGVRANPNCNPTVLNMMADGSLDSKSLITHAYSIEDAKKAFHTFINHEDGAVKVVIHPNGSEE